ncbi:hypothetical protein CSUB01_05355 [Colletotrichum sublineola]|uniref:Uncharacterized protein n=1 Tax=Colletotrichum sublineola TaxID=1173701 RepID=A0A066XJQ7_COLSU|nr:hypothetical protein CSUB01_05355 [Colletotrichum sublineola]
MKSSITLMPALLALARAAAIPEAAKAGVVSDAVLDTVTKEPVTNYLTNPPQAPPPAHGIPYDPWDPTPLSANPFKWYRESATVDDNESEKDDGQEAAFGALAWAALELEAIVATEGHPLSRPKHDDGGNDERFTEMRARDLEVIARGPTGRAVNATTPPDFHRGMTKDEMCSRFRGLMWKTGELMRPVQQWQQEYVPWLIDNKGPYIYTTNWTPLEEHDILMCYFQFSGIEWRNLVPLNWKTGGAAWKPPFDRDQHEWPHLLKVEQSPVDPPSRQPDPVLERHPSLKKLLRIITAKGPVSKYQTYANRRINNVLVNLERATMNVAKTLMDKFQNEKLKELMLFDIKPGQGVEHTLRQAKEAFPFDKVE